MESTTTSPALNHSGDRSSDGFSVSKLVRIPAGWFVMGSELGQDNEKPLHRIWIDEFEMAALQVTNGDYDRFLRETSAAQPPFRNDPAFNHLEQAVVAVSWFDATRYCEWLSEVTMRRFRLPTEAEWERAARGGRTLVNISRSDRDKDIEGTQFPWGDASPQSLPGYADRCADYWKVGPEPVGRGEPNDYGLYNMCDNVHEWCSDWYAPDYYSLSPERNPRGPETGERRASRGGSWRHHVKISRCAARSSIPPEFKYADYGFRVACDLR